MKNISTTIADLQAQWHTLTDLDRAKAVCNIWWSGTPIHEIASHLNCSETLLRHLLTALQAPLADRELAQRGMISTNELVRRSRTSGARRAARHREAQEFERTQEALHRCVERGPRSTFDEAFEDKIMHG